MNRILIVEDDQLIANIYRNKFLLEDFLVETASDGETALGLVKSFRPDAVLLDLMLPKMSGVELMRLIRAEPDFHKLPLVVFSNTFLTNLVREAWKAGATKCLSKANCTPMQVIAAVRNAIANDGSPGSQPLAPAAPPETRSAPRAPAAPATVVPVPTPQLQGELREAILASLPSTLNGMRGLLQSLSKAENDAQRLERIQDLCRQVHFLTGSAAVANLNQIAQLTEALEALLKNLCETPKNITVSPLRTIASAIDILGRLFDGLEQAKGPEGGHPPRILVVDDEAISRRAIMKALEKAKLSALSLEDPMAAYNLLAGNTFDLVFLDVDMPGMSGFELCAKLRTLPAHKDTPVVFVTSLDDFESRASSTVSGGTDFIAKPFLFVELAVKALVYVLNARLQAAS